MKEAIRKLEMLDEVVRRIDPKAKREGPQWTLRAEGHLVIVVADANADRMRAMTPIVDVGKIAPEDYVRMMQANFDSVLDVRYAIARGTVWSAFIHPLSPLSERELVSGIAQTVTAAATFGTTFSSGALIFGGGDSGELNERLYEKLMKKGDIEL